MEKINDQIERMARSAKRHIRYEREKAMKWIGEWNLRRPSIYPFYTSKALSAMWEARLFSDAALKDYEHPFTTEQMNAKVALRIPSRFA